MKTNVLQAVLNITESNILNIKNYNTVIYNNRINNTGEAFENFIKDSLCNCFYESLTEKLNLYGVYFSYLGNQNNPPDLIIKGSDAF